MKVTIRIILYLLIVYHGLYSEAYNWQIIDTEPNLKVTTAELSNTGVIYLGTYGSYILKTGNLGQDWDALAWPKNSSGDPITWPPVVMQIEIDPAGRIWTVCELTDPRGLLKSADGNTWEIEFWNTDDIPYNLDIVPNNDIYINIEGIIQFPGESFTRECDIVRFSKSGANHWESLLYQDVSTLGCWFNFFPHGNIQGQVLGNDSYMGAVYFYNNGTWESITMIHEDNDGYPIPTTVRYTELNSQGHMFAYLSSWVDHGLYRSTDYGMTWEKIGTTCDCSGNENLTIDANDILYLASGGNIYRSVDNGDSWEDIGFSGPNIYSMAVNDQGNIIVLSKITGESDEGFPKPYYYLTDYDLYYGQVPVSGTITITSPGPADTEINMLESTMIQWNYTGNVGNHVRIDLYQDNTFIKTITPQTPNDYAFTWDVTRHVNAGTLYRFKITSVSNPSIFDFSSSFEIVMNPNGRSPEVYTAGKIGSNWIPVIDGNLNDPIWAQTETDTLSYGDNPGDFNDAWTDFNDALVTWKAVWSESQDKLYVAVDVKDDIRGAFDNGELSADYQPSDDESIEIMTDGNGDGGEYWGRYDTAQFWRVTAENHRNLMHYPAYGTHPFTGNGFKTAVMLGNNGNWSCEIEMTIFDQYPDLDKNLWEGGRIAWDIWYNDSDNETTEDGTYRNDHQIGWTYLGPSWKIADYSGDIILGSTITLSPDTLRLQIFVEPELGGSVIVSPIKAFYKIGDIVTLNAQAGQGYQFLNWSGDTSSDEGSLILQMDGHKSITAHFQQEQETIDELQVDLPQETVNTETFTVPVQIGSYSGIDVTAYYCRLPYDSDNFSLLSVSSQGCLTESWNSPELNRLADDMVTISQSGSDALQGPGDLFKLVFQVNTDENVTLNLSWDEFLFNNGNPQAVTSDGYVTYASGQTGIQSQIIPQDYALKQNTPNPFNPSTQIGYALPEAGKINLDVFSINGKRVRSYTVDHPCPGVYTLTWDGRDNQGNALSSGTYIYRMRCNEFQQYMKALLIR